MYITEIIIQNNGGSYRALLDSLDQVRAFAKENGRVGDMLRVLRNGDKLGNAREIIIA
jgi:hypothetical protein